MTDNDIVTRLRKHVRGDYEKTAEFLLGLAADEIEHLRADRDKWRNVADELYLSGNCSETCVDGAGGDDCCCSWGGAQWEYEQAVAGE